MGREAGRWRTLASRGKRRGAETGREKGGRGKEKEEKEGKGKREKRKRELISSSKMIRSLAILFGSSIVHRPLYAPVLRVVVPVHVSVHPHSSILIRRLSSVVHCIPFQKPARGTPCSPGAPHRPRTAQPTQCLACSLLQLGNAAGPSGPISSSFGPSGLGSVSDSISTISL